MNISSDHIFVREITSELSNVLVVEELIDLVSEHFHIPEELKFNIQVALIEAVNNAIIHGNDRRLKKTVIITCVKFDQFLRFSIKDEGDGFDFSCKKDPTKEGSVDKPNGRGLFLINKLSDRVGFHDRGRTIQIDFRNQ